MGQSGFVAQGRVMAMWVRWSGNGGGGTAVGMILCTSSLSSVSSYEGFHMFVELSLMSEGAKDTLLLLLMSFNVEFEMLNRK